ncbi:MULTISPECIES: hypothetical protein [Pontibacillus]|uniref:DUF4367 domain-containing protein n=1 Tax=Pontibacillus chungwhensis TaxID=265426 RepID=A0ABY8V2J1_9BACI|nr:MULTISPECIES: hypothetical protein [Pontibacillus]MCD5322573.1 hypothetical protein [Pontibacillus sp. HN14]WIF99858.1 hypothetical protein QNI29_09415 [Pontibacillus chungwhensis]
MRKLLRWFSITFLALFIIVGSIGFAFKDTLFQEGNPIPVISGIVQLKFGDKPYVQIDSESESYITPHTPVEGDYYYIVKTFMGEKGWAFLEQDGTDLIFSKGNDQTTVETRMYTSDYYIFSISQSNATT